MTEDTDSMFDIDVANLYEYLIRYVYESILQDGDVGIDIGANQGFHTFPMAKMVEPSGKIFAFEPIPIHYHQLFYRAKSSAEFTNVVEMLPYAMSDAEDRVDFTVNLDNTAFCSGLHRNENIKYGKTKTFEVRTRTLDNFYSYPRRIKFIKIDVDGAELQVLKGARSTIASHQPIITFECGDFCSASYGYESAEIFDLLASLDYCVYTIKGEALSSKSAFAACTKTQEVWNFVAIPRSSNNSGLVSRLQSIAKSLDKAAEKPDGCSLYQSTSRTAIMLSGVYDHTNIDLTISNFSNSALLNFSTNSDGAGTVAIGLVWHQNGKYITEDRRALPRTILPGESDKISIHVSSSTSVQILDPGQYVLSIDIVKEHMYWFGSSVKFDVVIS